MPKFPPSMRMHARCPCARMCLRADDVMNPLLESLPVDSVKADDFDAVFLPGGHGTCWVGCGTRPSMSDESADTHACAALGASYATPGC